LRRHAGVDHAQAMVMAQFASPPLMQIFCTPLCVLLLLLLLLLTARATAALPRHQDGQAGLHPPRPAL
jgi:hypothetical protein